MDEDALVPALLDAARAAGALTAGDLPGGGAVVLGPGDDAALLRPPPGHELVWTTDDQWEGVHVDLGWLETEVAGAEAAGAKAAGASLSDLAAMGATPLGALLSIGAPPRLGPEHVLAAARGVGRVLGACACPLVGGNVSRHPERLALTVTALGTVPAGQALRRSSGRAGDRLYVSGQLGWARLSLLWLQAGGDAREPELARAIQALLDPRPRLALGETLRVWAARAGGGRALACMDLSDGLAADLPRLARASGLAARVDAAALPGPDPELARRVGQRPHDLAWMGGEDYELLVAGPAELGEDVPELVAIGELVVGAPGAVQLLGDAESAPGFDHFRT